MLTPKLKITNPRTQRQYDRLLREWNQCDRCNLMNGRTHVVHAQGRFPCSVLFIGEAPDFSEDRTGYPGTGVSGKLLIENFIPALQAKFGRKFTYAIIYLVGCVPSDTFGNLRHPEFTEISTCRPHLDNLMSMAAPKACLLLGRLAEKHIGNFIVGKDLQPIVTHQIYQAAYIHRNDGPVSAAFAPWVTTTVEYLRTVLP